MSDTWRHDDGQLVIESVTQLDGSPVPQTGWRGASGWREKLGKPGTIALAEGLALVCCFSLPWFAMVRTAFADGPGLRESDLRLVGYSGWSIAWGMPLSPTGSPRLALFVHLWLIPAIAGALLVIAWLYVQRRLSAQLAAGMILALSGLALLLAIGYAVQVSSLALAMTGPGASSPVRVAWGCWAATAVAGVASAASAISFRPQRGFPVAAGEAEGWDD